MSARGGAGDEIARMMVLSTQHLHPLTVAGWIDQCPWACFEKGDFGWFMYVCDDPGITEAADIPLEVRSALHVARRERCEWIMWDREGPTSEELPHYDW